MKFCLLFYLLFFGKTLSSQEIKLTTIVKNINASGGITLDKTGNIYVSDFGDALGKISENTKVYKVDKITNKVSVFAEGFRGASGSCFDSKGNFYQSNPFGNRISKVATDKKVIADWSTIGFKTPIGITANDKDELFVCNCSGNSISKISSDGVVSTFATSKEFNCPNGLTIDNSGNLYACNFNDGNILRIDKKGITTVFAELPSLQGGSKPVGNGHLTWKNGFLFVVTIGRGELYRIDADGNSESIAGIPLAFTNNDGSSENATFCKPNGIAASITGDTLYVNVSENSWNSSTPLSLHPAHLRMITGINSLGKIKTSKSKDQSDEEIIRGISKKFSQYYMDANYENLINCYTSDAKIFPDKAPIIAGKEAIKKRWTLPEGIKVTKHSATPTEIKVNGDYAYDYGYYEVATKRSDGSTTSGKGKYIIVWRKENGIWKIYLDIWNSVQE